MASDQEAGSSTSLIGQSSRCSICGCAKEAKKFRKEVREMFTKLTSTIVDLRKEIRSGTRATPTENTILDNTDIPFKTLQELTNFETKLASEDQNMLDFQKLLVLKGCNDQQSFIKKHLKMLFADAVAQQYNWQGVNTKKSTRKLKTITALKNAFHQKFPGTPEDIFEKAVMKHFQYAKDRLKKKESYKTTTVNKSAGEGSSSTTK